MAENSPQAAPQPQPQPQPMAPQRPLSIEERIQLATVPPPEPQAAPEHEPELAAHDAPSDEPQAAEAEADEPQEAEAEVEEIVAENFGDLAEHLGVDVNELYNLKLSVEVDGQPQAVTIEEVKTAYREAKRAAAEREKLNAARQKLEQDAAQSRARVQQSLAESAKLIESAEYNLLSDIQGTNWDELRQTDPSEWTMKRQEFGERRQAIEQAKAEARRQLEKYQQEQQQQMVQQRQEYLQSQRAALLEAIPEWQDPNKYQAGAKELSEYLATKGFSSQEIEMAADSRLLALARKAMLYDRRESASETAKKRVIKLGKKVSQPGNTSSKVAAREDRDASLSRALKKSGKVSDAAAIIRARLQDR